MTSVWPGYLDEFGSSWKLVSSSRFNHGAMLISALVEGRDFPWNFAGRLVDIFVQRANNAGTYWVGGIAGTPLVAHLFDAEGHGLSAFRWPI